MLQMMTNSLNFKSFEWGLDATVGTNQVIRHHYLCLPNSPSLSCVTSSALLVGSDYSILSKDIFILKKWDYIFNPFLHILLLFTILRAFLF